MLTMLYFRSQRARLTETPTEDTAEEMEDANRPLAVLLGGCAVASLGLFYGSEWFVDGARRIAINNGVSDHIIGLTVVAFGTSVPELVASGIAAYKREPDLALGNLIGSNIFNVFLAAGISASIIPQSRHRAMKSMFVGAISPGTASTARMLRMLEPTTLPMAMSVWPLRAEPMVAASSGRLVPIATIVRPMIISLTPSAIAMLVAA